eukprot:12056207-Prorocentrum_lima.AAC.1
MHEAVPKRQRTWPDQDDQATPAQQSPLATPTAKSPGIGHQVVVNPIIPRGMPAFGILEEPGTI